MPLQHENFLNFTTENQLNELKKGFIDDTITQCKKKKDFRDLKYCAY